MKHTLAHHVHHHNKRFKENKTIPLFLSTLLVLMAIVSIVRISTATTPYTAELRFAETSDVSGVIGGMLPASCESGGNNLAGAAHTSACAWTQYCTGGSDINGNNWQIWEYSNDDTIDYRNTGGTCAPTPTVNLNFQ
jgi:hypothetical protein